MLERRSCCLLFRHATYIEEVQIVHKHGVSVSYKAVAYERLLILVNKFYKRKLDKSTEIKLVTDIIPENERSVVNTTILLYPKVEIYNFIGKQITHIPRFKRLTYT